MKHLKSIILPVIGMALVFLFIGLAYVAQSPLLGELLVCGLILTIIFGIRMSSILKQENSLNEVKNEKKAVNGSLLQSELKKEQWQY